MAITDGSPLYKDSLQQYWSDIEHQLCIFHVIKEVNKLILGGVRAIKGLQRMPQPLDLLIAGIGFEPMTFGL
ncbi:MAG: hypothetical protein O7G88_14210 [bacterium]|nr:hypothetical protein [bacterium]